MSNQLKVKVVSSKVILPDSLGGIDVTNILASDISVLPYTASEDCYAYVAINGGSNTITIDGKEVSYYVFDTRAYTGFTNILKKGQTINGSGLVDCRIYGIKY